MGKSGPADIARSPAVSNFAGRKAWVDAGVATRQNAHPLDPKAHTPGSSSRVNPEIAQLHRRACPLPG
jgi:hypothetical protein